MKSILKTVLVVWSVLFSMQINAQTIITIDGNQLVQDGNYIVLDNAKFVNNGTFKANNGTLKISGDATDANASIAGSSSTTFYNLEINKSSNNAFLESAIIVANTLTLTSGLLDINDMNLTISSGGTISGGSSSSFVKTSNTGLLMQEVGTSNIVFPIGNSSYTPATLNNSGTTDNFSLRIENLVYLEGISGSEVTTDIVDCSWYVSESVAGGSDVSMTVQWNSSDELTDFDRTQAFLSEYSSSVWNNFASQAASGSDPYTLTQANLTDFSVFTVASDAAVLPVELLYFYAEKEGQNVRLDWQTATELNNAYFDLEWSIDGINFEKINQIQGAGTINNVQFYTSLHKSPVLGLNYYRLKQVDFDGKFEYSAILSVEFQTSNIDYQIYPNPASHFITIENAPIGAPIQVFSINGQLVEQHEAPVRNLSISHLPKGTYFIKIENVVKRILIQ